MSYLRVPEWSPDEVADWIKGLEECFRPYIQSFLNNDIDGRHLMVISSDDLNHLNIWKIGHQELLMEAVEQLRQSFYDLDVENLQWLALKLSCKAKSLVTELSKPYLPLTSHPSQYNYNYYYHHQSSLNDKQTTLNRKQDQVATSTLSAVADLISSVKALVTWINRPPFSSQLSFRKKRSILIQRSVELATNAQRDKFAEKPNEVIRDICLEIDAICDELIKEKRDPIVLQPSSLEIATIKKKPNEELGMDITSFYCGIHVIGSIKYQSPTSASGRVETGDEIVQVNYQTVVGWQLKKLVAAMKENASEVIVTLKKRPKHSNTFGRIFPNNFMFMSKRLSPKTNRARLSPKVNTESPLISSHRPSLKPAEDSFHKSSTSISQTVPVPIILQPPLITVPDNATTVTSTAETITEDEDDDSAFLSEADSRSLASDIHLSIPKMHVALQRRATVTGASPTATRPPVSIDQLWHNAKRDQIMRSYSHDVSKSHQERDLKSDVKENFGSKFGKDTSVKSQWTNNNIEKTSTPVTAANSETQTKFSVFSEVGTAHLTSADSGTQPCKSYQVVIVGGVPHRQPSNSKDFKNNSSTLPVLRKKRKSYSHSKRRVSCKDLGEGECQGWLFRWKEVRGVFLNSHKWVKQWCILKNRNFYVYDDEQAPRARCFICLKGFNVSPGPDCYKSKRYAFHIYRSGASFLFCSESQSDLSKWMNKLGLAAIDYETNNQKQEPNVKNNVKQDEDYSETEDEDEEVLPVSSDDRKFANSNQNTVTSSLSSSSFHANIDSLDSTNCSLSQIKKEQLTRYNKSKSLEWKSFPKALDTFPSLPSTPVTETAKMSLAFEMNLDSAPSSPLKMTMAQQWIPGFVTKQESPQKSSQNSCSKVTSNVHFSNLNAETLPKSISNKSSQAIDSKTPGSPKLMHIAQKPTSLFKKEDLLAHRVRDFQNIKETKKLFRISSIPSHQDDEDTVTSKLESEHNDCEPTTPKTVGKPAMGVSMIGKQRRISENRASTSSYLQAMTTISQATQTDNRIGDVDSLARLGVQLHEADLHIDGTQRFLRQKNSVFCPHPDHRKSQVLLHLRALQRTLTAKKMDLEAIDQLLSNEITSRTLRKWKDDHAFILESEINSK